MTTETTFHGLGYDQVLLVPGASNVLPHTVSLTTQLAPQLSLNIPLIAEAVSPATDARAIPVALSGGMGVVAAQADIALQVAEVRRVKETTVDIQAHPKAAVDAQGRLRVAAEVWVDEDAAQRVAALVEAQVDALFLYLREDVTASVVAQLEAIRAQYPEAVLAVGVVEQPDVAAQLYQLGVNIVLAGRSVNSPLPNDVTYPFLTVTLGIAEVAAQYEGTVIAVGGVHYSGDVVKAIAAGADAALVSDLLKGSTLADDGTVTGGDLSVEDGIFQTDGGLRAGMGYTGSASIEALQLDGQFVQITDNGLRESHPHDVEITKQAPNYLQ
jgi:IMP dehydrogenase/GMP reductase